MKTNNFTIAITGDIDTFETEDEKCLSKFLDTLESHGITCTLPVTADAVKNYPERAKYILQRGHEIAGHGDVHEPFRGPVDRQVERLKKMIDKIFQYTGYKVEGFRAPFINADSNLFKALETVGLKYDSTLKVFGYICKYIPYYRKHYFEGTGYTLLKPAFNAAGGFYNFLNKRTHAPYKIGDVLEIPVIGDSDYTLIDAPRGPRFSKHEALKVAGVWWEHVKRLRKNHKAVALQAHPGRVSPDYLDGLNHFCEKCLESGITFLTLKEITETAQSANTTL